MDSHTEVNLSSCIECIKAGDEKQKSQQKRLNK